MSFPSSSASVTEQGQSEDPSPGSDDDALSREVLSPDGVSSADAPAQDGSGEGEDGEADISSPGKIIRIGSMVKQLLEEVRNTDLDDEAREQLRRIYENSLSQLRSALSPELGDELENLSFDFSDDDAPTDAELRMAKAQLVGWLEGLFHGIQATLMAQQMSARQQLEGMRGQIPERSGPQGPGGPGYI
jgi:Bacterial proteasome activator